jgi:hydrogenase nickel insertion protein HypA
MARISIDPVTRIEGHLRIDVEVDGGTVQKVWASCTMWRGIETILRHIVHFYHLSALDWVDITAMHELSIAKGIIEIAEAKAREENSRCIQTIKVRLGEFTTVVREALEFAFEVACLETLAKNARLEIEAQRVFEALRQLDQLEELKERRNMKFLGEDCPCSQTRTERPPDSFGSWLQSARKLHVAFVRELNYSQ